MAALTVLSAFFSSSEAAYFSLDGEGRRRLMSQGRAGRRVVRLLRRPDRLLTTILFGNLLVNILYFTATSIVGLRLQRGDHALATVVFSFGALAALIVFSETVPKSVAVLAPGRVAKLWSAPLRFVVRGVTPILPILETANLLSRRLLCPRFRPEPYLRTGDLRRAVELSRIDEDLLHQEELVLQNIVRLTEYHVSEVMRPRTMLKLFSSPISVEEIRRRPPSCGYVLITEKESDDIIRAVPLAKAVNFTASGLEALAEDVHYVPWCVSAAAAFEAMRRAGREVVVVVDEYGTTIGVLTFRDVLDALFGKASSRAQRVMNIASIRGTSSNKVWLALGITTLKRIEEHFGVEGAEMKNAETVSGVFQEMFGRFPQAGDTCRWGRYVFNVKKTMRHRPPEVELELLEEIENEESP
jgi:putative hemolysin